MESQCHPTASFATLTYSPESLPMNGSLQKRDVQLLHKRLRRAGAKFRYFTVGEYGSKTLRPHYHSIYFGMDPEMTESLLNRHWPHGFVQCGEVSTGSMQYVAGYTLKKMTNPKDWPEDDPREPEFSITSRRPGIGLPYLPRLVETWKSNPGLIDTKTPNLLRFEGKQWPLDPYVGLKLTELLERQPNGIWSNHFATVQRLISQPPPNCSQEGRDYNYKAALRRALAKRTL